MERTFTGILPAERILTSDADKAHYGRDWLPDFSPTPSHILLPKSTDEVQKIVLYCNEHRIPLVPSGGRTGLSGGATASRNEVVLSLEKMNRVLEVNPIDRTIRVEAGVVTQKVQDAAKDVGLYFPIEFTTKGSSQIGGNVATNAGGIRVIKYGNTRDWVLGMTVVLGDGQKLSLNGSLFKNQTGYDIKSLLIGSEGTLGIITELTLKLTSYPGERVRLVVAIESVTQVLPLLHKVREQFPNLSAFEYFTEAGLKKVLLHHKLPRPFTTPYPAYVLIEIERRKADLHDELEDGFAALIEESLILDAIIGSSEKQHEELLSIREKISETLSMHYSPHKNDVSVPVPTIPAFVVDLEKVLKAEYADFERVIFGHIGDGNLHVNILKPADLSKAEFLSRCHEVDNLIFKVVAKYNGSISAEHGVGLLKKEFLHYSRTPEEIALMKAIKRVFDPLSILNPGKIFDLE